MSLTTAPITELTALSAPKAILREWLASYFDGNYHPVGDNSTVRFPKCSLHFAVTPNVQPLSRSADVGGTTEECSIRLVVHRRAEKGWMNADVLRGTHRRIHSGVQLHFWVKAKRQGTGESELLAANVAQLLKALLTNPSTRYALAEKGITALTPQAPDAMPEAGASLYLVPCGAEFHYAVRFDDSSEDEVETGGGAGEQAILFTKEQPLLSGQYLPGGVRWTTGATGILAAVWAHGPIGASCVLTLEVAGVLTAHTLTIATGDTEVYDDVDLSALLIPPHAVLRWKCTSAPVAEESAYNVSVELNVVVA